MEQGTSRSRMKKRKRKRKGNFISPNIALDLNSTLFDFFSELFLMVWHIAFLLPTLWTSSYMNEWVNGWRKTFSPIRMRKKKKINFRIPFQIIIACVTKMRYQKMVISGYVHMLHWIFVQFAEYKFCNFSLN